MKPSGVVLFFSAACVLLCGGLVRAQNPGVAANPLEQIAWFVGGTWSAEEKASDGSTLLVKLNCRWADKNISVVGDYAERMQAVTEGSKPFWMVLQIAWSGVTKPGKTLRFPTLPEERYMAYQAIIRGARGLVFFGGDIAAAMNARDKALGWNWTFYRKVLQPVLQELNPAGPALCGARRARFRSARPARCGVPCARGRQPDFHPGGQA